MNTRSKSPLNIMFILQRYPGFGGIEEVTHTLTENFIQNYGHNITIFSTSRQDCPSQNINHPNYKLVTTDLKGNSLKIYFNTLISKKCPDILIYQDSYIPEEFLLENIPENIKIIVCEHNTPDCLETGLKFVTKSLSPINPANIIRKFLLPWRMRRLRTTQRLHHQHLFDLADKYILLSDKFRPILKSLYGIEGDKIISIPNPIDIKNGTEWRQKEDIVLFVARLTSQKGLRHLVKIWEQIQDKCHWRLQIVGDGEERPWLETQIIRRNLKRVELFGFHANVDKFYNRAKVHFMTSVYEGLGLTNLEAASMGVIPFVFNSFASASDLIQNGANGFLIKPFDTEAYAKTFLDFVNLPEQDKIKMSQDAARSIERFSSQKTCRKWQELFKYLTAKNKI